MNIPLFLFVAIIVITASFSDALFSTPAASTTSTNCGVDKQIIDQAIADFKKTTIKNLPVPFDLDQDSTSSSNSIMNNRRRILGTGSGSGGGTGGGGSSGGGSYKKIRITVSTLDLYDSDQHCTAAGQTRPDFRGGTRTCTSDDVLTDAKRSNLINKIIPEAVRKLQRTLRVRPLRDNLRVGSTDQCSGGFTIPSSHVSPGIPDTDYVLYVAAGPTPVGITAFAGGCQYDNNVPRRIIVGRSNFGPYYLDEANMPVRDAANTMVHEFLHAMGFTETEFDNRLMTSRMTVRGESRTVITTEKPRDEARDWMGCGSLPGVELEQEGGSGTAGSHMERRTYMNDVMAGASGEALSIITLSIMEALGVYLPYYNESENSITGKNLGCGWAEGSCTDTVPAQVYCGTPSSSDVQCTSNLKGYGPCSDGFLTDNCNYYQSYGNRMCYDLSQADDETGNTFDNNSRCFGTSGTFRQSSSSVSPSNNERCLKARCIDGVLSFAVGRSSTTYVTCSASGSTETYTGYDGNVICPNITDMCDSLEQYHDTSASDDEGTLQPIKDNKNGTQHQATRWVYTTKLILTLSGTSWADALDGNNYSTFELAMQHDVAQLLGIESQQVKVLSITALASGNGAKFVINLNTPDLSTQYIYKEFASFLARRSWMPRTIRTHDSVTSSSSSSSNNRPVLAAVSSEDKPTNFCTNYDPSIESDSKCTGILVGISIAILVAFALVCAGVYYLCCKPKSEKLDEREERV